ncbi:hypothetical protein [Thermoleptolyngbya sp. C42_A2020_037]|uniref:hypothetical protein n=1 Tax=Thermoleptolyngbya sp. C42_A2020_037 TaxID=2747799 RepID=UPI001A06CDD1|nr:hypothetical protein [Thermoleptolyngbya sp. C42_A2020_037]MBF2084601.1 hypothetical protein [Thermoleptolyngbya sp. C42_A2020_037]
MSGTLLPFLLLFLPKIPSSTELTCDRPTLETTRCQKTQFIGSLPIYRDSVELQSSNQLEVQVTVLKLSDNFNLGMLNDFYEVRIWIGIMSSGTETWTALKSLPALRFEFSNLEMRVGLWKNPDEARAIADKIQRFLSNPAQSSLRDVHPPISWMQRDIEYLQCTLISLLPIWAYLIFPLSSILRGYCKFNRLTGKLSFKPLFGKAKTVPLSDIESIAIEEFQWTSSSSGLLYRIVALTKTGKRLPIELAFIDSNLSIRQETAKVIQDFLDLPPVQIISPGNSSVYVGQ